MTDAEELLCAILRGESSSFLSPRPIEVRPEQLIETAFHHGLHLVLLDRIRRSFLWERWPLSLREGLENLKTAAATTDLIFEAELRRVLTRSDERGIRPILLKGVPFAYTIYDSPTLRPRADTDLLVREHDFERFAHVLLEMGYEGPVHPPHLMTSYQCSFRRVDPLGIPHVLDVHWKINNAQVFANIFSFDELSIATIRIPKLVPIACGLGNVHALLLACMHRFGHTHAPFYSNGSPVYAGDHLRWVYDIHLLSLALKAGEWPNFCSLAVKKGIAEYCLDGLCAAAHSFNTRIPDEVLRRLQSTPRNTSLHLENLKSSSLHWFAANLRAFPSWRRRFTFIKETTFPSRAYMKRRYNIKSPIALYFLYGYRAVGGVIKRLKMPHRP